MELIYDFYKLFLLISVKVIGDKYTLYEVITMLILFHQFFFNALRYRPLTFIQKLCITQAFPIGPRKRCLVDKSYAFSNKRDHS